jgi:voltage-gated potassium channel
MKFLTSQLAYLTTEREARANLKALFGYFGFLFALISMYAVLFHVIKLYVEGEQHSWITGFYWTLVVMSTLGFGDIIFTSDVGRVFSVVVLLSGVFFLLVMLPFLFIRLFYAPWLEARVRLKAPREVPANVHGHVILIELDDIARGLVDRLKQEGVPYVVLESDVTRAAHATDEGLSMMVGEHDSRATYERAGVGRARMVIANSEDTINTNVTLTIREVAPHVPVVAIVEEEDAVDVLQLSGATTVLPLKHQLGAYLANRVDAGQAEAHVIGRYRNLQLAELPARDLPFVGLSVKDTRLRERTGLSLVGLWERGKLKPAYPHTVIDSASVLVVAGTAEQMTTLNTLIDRTGVATGPVLVVGAGKVGQAVARALRAKGLAVHLIDRDRAALDAVTEDVEAVFCGDAADRRVLERAGIDRSPSLLLTTNDDAMNIYLAVYCRRLNPALRIISRVTHERNVEAIHRAGADFALSYTTLGVEAVLSLLRGHEPVLLGEGVELFAIRVPESLVGRTLRQSGIGSRTGMSVIGALEGDGPVGQISAEMLLDSKTELIMLGSREQRREFAEAYEGARQQKS